MRYSIAFSFFIFLCSHSVLAQDAEKQTIKTDYLGTVFECVNADRNPKKGSAIEGNVCPYGFGGLSGLTYDSDAKHWLFISDGDHYHHTAFFRLGIIPQKTTRGYRFNASWIGGTNSNPTFLKIGDSSQNFEGESLFVSNGKLWWSSENKGSKIIVSSMEGKSESVNQVAKNGELPDNCGLEAMTQIPNSSSILYALERPAKGNIVDIVEADTVGLSIKNRYKYELGFLDSKDRPVTKTRKVGLDCSEGLPGLVAITALDDKRFLTLERMWDGIVGKVTSQVFLVRVPELTAQRDAADSLTKTLLIDINEINSLTHDNFEGMSIGPLGLDQTTASEPANLSNKKMLLLLVSDDNFNKFETQKTVLAAFSIWEGDDSNSNCVDEASQ